jgi:hypothetical protein
LSDEASDAGRAFGSAARRAIARHPLRWFFALALGAAVLAGTAVSLQLVDRVNGSGFPVAAAMLVVWAEGSRREWAPRRGARLAVFLATLAIYLLPAWFGYGDTSLVPLPSAVCVALALASLYSPRATMRDLARPLGRLRSSASAYVVGLVAWPAIAVLVVVAAHLWARGPVFVAGWDRVPRLHASFEAVHHGFLAAVPTAIAWYGFTARRLLDRLSPLITALLVGPLVTLASLIPLILWSSPPGDYLIVTLLNATGLAAVAVWVFQRSQGSLVPVGLFLLEANAVPLVVLLWSPRLLGSEPGSRYLMVGLLCALALVLAVEGRMWRRPSRAETPVARPVACEGEAGHSRENADTESDGAPSKR